MYKYFTDKSGQALVEFAILLPVFLLLLCGMLQFGMVFHDYLVVNEAAREGARLAAVGASDGDIKSKVIDAAATITLPTDSVTIEPTTKRITGDQVTVTVSTPVRMALPFVGEFVTQNGNLINLQGKVVMRVEQDTTL